MDAKEAEKLVEAEATTEGRKRAEKLARGEGEGSETPLETADLDMADRRPLESLSEAEARDRTTTRIEPKETDYTGRHLDDPVVQRLYDKQALIERLREVRTGLAAGKVNMLLAQEGLLHGEGIHHQQLKKILADHRTAIATLTQQYTRLMALWDDEGADWRPPGDSDLEIAGTIPKR